MTNEPYGSKSWNYLGFLIISWKLFNIFRILFLYVSEWIEKSLHLHCSTFNSAISVKICSFEEFNSALLAKFEVQSANFNSACYLCSTKKCIPLSEPPVAPSESSFPEEPFPRTSLNIGFLLYPVLLLCFFSVLIWKYLTSYS